jgi:phenylacetate-CoA ligase
MKKYWNKLVDHMYYGNRTLAVNLYGYYLKKRRFSRAFWKELAQLEDLAALTLAQQKEKQFESLKVIIQHAYQHVPFYTKRFDDYDFHPKQLQDFSDLTAIPILTKEDIRQNYYSLLATNISNRTYTVHETSGTTGTKLKFAISSYLHWTLKFAHLYHHYSWAGIQPGDKRVTIGGRIFTNRSPYWVYNHAENQLLMSIHHLSSITVDSYLDIIRQFQPKFIQGHPTGIARLAERLIAINKYLPVKAVFTTGETLELDNRLVIEEAFQCHIYDFYGQGEGIFYAGECSKHAGYHELSSMGYIELLPLKEQALCSVIGTSLHNYAMPMIRYEIGDVAAPAAQKECDCGRGYPLKIAKVIGRIDDRVYLSPEDYVLPVTIRMAIKPILEEGQSYQFHQLDFENFNLRISSSYEITDTQKASLRKALSTYFVNQVNIDITRSETLLTSGGKIRNVISEVAKTIHR